MVVRITFEPGRPAATCTRVQDLDKRNWCRQVLVQRSSDSHEPGEEVDDAEGPLVVTSSRSPAQRCGCSGARRR